MNKVTLEITPMGWEVKINVNGKEYVEKHISDAPGTAKCVEGSFEAESELSDELVDAVGGFFAFDVMNALFNEI